ncbi:DNA-binding transcriptional regulator, ArsR family [Arthrobacter alpinus]|uniref:DNA-binding transcriptional regulator, ArsR family n=1 Tax=Arthrobacter alpinus TaxID=656366 RepID=A0A1H5MHB0_9MICC|nr:metalloregulator ArsR/SmtB family transcription factor [Arthrobacter alpinus]SEE88470.1 DNA-binding transcriptional regulator, ArsR family [Arthrobacter alpinus]
MVAEKVFAVIAESTRRDILEALAQESKAVGQLVDELGVSQPTVSKHLRVLREAGVVTMRAQGQKRFYGLNTAPLALVSTWLDSLGASAASPSTAAIKPADTARKLSAVDDGQVTRPATKPRPAAADATSPAPAVVPSAAPVAAPAAAVAETTAPAVKVTPSAPVQTAPRQVATIVHPNDVDAGVQSQLSRSVGRAANKAADLLANLPTLPTFKRRKN